MSYPYDLRHAELRIVLEIVRELLCVASFIYKIYFCICVYYYLYFLKQLIIAKRFIIGLILHLTHFHLQILFELGHDPRELEIRKKLQQ